MPSFQITLTPSRRAAARFVTGVRRSLQKALATQQRASGLTKSDIARAIGVHRSVINRELNGYKDLTLGRVAELTWALGGVPVFDIQWPNAQHGCNIHVQTDVKPAAITTTLTNASRIANAPPDRVFTSLAS
jgi:plasmid maintenance system antidote protein VapI